MQDSSTMYNALTFTLILRVLLCVYADPVVKIGNTNVIGRVSGSSGKVDFFGGIPFAEPPLGELRLNFPVLSTTLNTETLVAKDFGPGCLQVPAPPSGLSEDCLTLDVYRPAGISSEAKLPVLVWIYGGGFVVGATSFYNATDIVSRSVSRGTPIIFVSINYRVGPLGFPQGNEAGQRNILNLGLHDQVTALQWIQQNIHNFGGDKTKVTISGESAGAGSIQIFFLTSKIAGLARGAILESTGWLPAFVPERNEDNWQEFVNAIPACASSGLNDTFDCIRSATSSSLEQALVTTNINFNNMSFVPVIDGPGGFMPNRMSQIKNENNLPSILGSNLDEGTIFTPQTINSAAEIEERLTAMISPPSVTPQQLESGEQQLLKLYPDIPALGSPFGTGNDTFGLSPEYKRYAAMFGDFIFHSARRTLSQQLSEAGIPAFVYHFTDPDAVAVAEFAPPSTTPGSIGTPHTSEIPYVFGTLMNITPRAIALSAVMQDYWISFVNELDPNDERGGQRPKWEQYVPNNEAILNLNGERISTMPDNFRRAQIAFLQNNPDLLHR